MTGEEQQFLDAMRAELAPIRERLDGHDTTLKQHGRDIASNTTRHDENDELWAEHVKAANGRAEQVQEILNIVTNMQTQQNILIADVARHEADITPWRELWSGMTRIYEGMGRWGRRLMWLIGFLLALGQLYIVWSVIAQGMAP